jgi:hydrogenase nickel incorporation protein HypA/HybF
MHELSIAMSVVEMAEEESQKRGGVRVTSVRMRLGALAGVVKEALLSSYELAIEDTALAGSHLEIEEVSGVVYCPACDAQRPVTGSEWFRCNHCGALASQIVHGKELEVVSLEVEQ